MDAGITDEKLEKYGLTEPDAKLSFSLNGSEHELAVSAKDSDGMRYMTADGNDLVYRVDNSAVTNWADANLMSLRMSYVWIANIKDVKKLTVTIDGSEVHSFDITREKDEEKSTDTSTEYDISKIVDGDGNSVDYEVYQPFYRGADTVEYYEIPGNRYAALLNGSFNGQVRGTDFDGVMALLP